MGGPYLITVFSRRNPKKSSKKFPRLRREKFLKMGGGFLFKGSFLLSKRLYCKKLITYRYKKLILGVFRAKMFFQHFMGYKIHFVNQTGSDEKCVNL